MDYSNILMETDGDILKITINRPEKLNALNKQTLVELNHVLLDAFENAKVGGIIITGSGEKAFVAGADISEFANYNQEEGENLARDGQYKVFDLIANAQKPIIAAINGFALGGGLELALACHIRFASENAKLGLPEVSLGLIPGYGGTQRLTQVVGKGKAMELILSANMIDADEASKMGLVNKVCALDQLLPEAKSLLKTILSRSPKAVAAAILAVNAAVSTNGFATEIVEFGKCFGNEDFKEGVSAFLGKRKPNFK
ncbi:enoyl-CoA hydratase/isomerase family protein [Pedobacter arcticus]|uniref:enoyl-CoA hydratase/isomerase family protein n=1 Tax=Pedobacter arcticus TaxID=752140 RepID=UPI00047531E6|nr:enoyl-CoA hydratase-related protein [Pedobacter arcticus]